MTAIRRVLKAAALASIVIVACGLALPPLPPAPHRPPEMTRAEKKWIESRFRYHGITSCIHDPETGEHYFYRDGRKCRL